MKTRLRLQRWQNFNIHISVGFTCGWPGRWVPSLPSGQHSFRKPSFPVRRRQFLASDSCLEPPENPQGPFIGKGWVVNFPSVLLGLSLYSWLL